MRSLHNVRISAKNFYIPVVFRLIIVTIYSYLDLPLPKKWSTFLITEFMTPRQDFSRNRNQLTFPIVKCDLCYDTRKKRTRSRSPHPVGAIPTFHDSRKASRKAKQNTESVFFTTSSLKHGQNSKAERPITNFHTSNPFPLTGRLQTAHLGAGKEY